MTDVGITKIGEGCPQLQSLNLYYCSQVTDVGITKIGEGCPQLQSLNLSLCSVTDVGVSKIEEGCPKLQSLNLFFSFSVFSAYSCGTFYSLIVGIG